MSSVSTTRWRPLPSPRTPRHRGRCCSRSDPTSPITPTFHHLGVDMSPFIPAARLARIRESPSVAAAQRVRELRAEQREILDLTVGEPDFDTPDHVKAAAVAAITTGQTKYTAVNGIPALRAAISNRMLDRTGIAFDHRHITVGGGAKQVIFLALMATVEEGVEVIVPAPYWVSYPDMVSVHGGTPVIVECTETERFVLTAGKLEAAITPATRWVILNSPSNPTGAVYTRQELIALAEVFERNPHVNVLCDEIYDEIVFTGTRLPNLLSVAPHLRDRIFGHQRRVQDIRDDRMAPRLRRWQSRTGRGDRQAAVTEFILPVVDEPCGGCRGHRRRPGVRRRVGGQLPRAARHHRGIAHRHRRSHGRATPKADEGA